MRVIKKSNICKHVHKYKVDTTIKRTYQPVAGDVAIFEVMHIGSLNAVQNYEGRNCYIFEGDRVMLAFGNRYASNQFEAYVPEGYQNTYDFIGKGGVVGKAKSMYYRLTEIGPTILRMIGFATDNKGQVINTIYHHRPASNFVSNKVRPFKTILSIGSSMDSGKTTTAAFLARGLQAAGSKVGYLKLTGTVFNKDRMLVLDCGASVVSDFSEFGFPSTYLCSLEQILNLYEGLLNDIAIAKPDYLIIEVADGLYQRETNLLLNSPGFVHTIDRVILSCSDSLAVHTGVNMLHPIFGNRLFALAGLFTGSPLLVNEVEKQNLLPVLTLDKLMDPQLISSLVIPKVEVAV